MILRINKYEKSRLTETSGHRIKVVVLKDIKKWIQDINPIEKCIGWIVRVIKANDIKEEITKC
tara:strand:- start:31 stop:219 length:189 start_codon:yes stop_codon:yes gene_type:complete